MRYLDLDVEIGPGTGRGYPVVVRSSAAGDARLTMQFPYDELALKDTLKDLRIALLQSSQTHRALTEEEQAVQAFGQRLFEALFAGMAGNLFHASRAKATQEGLLGVRLRLHIQAPDLAALPWEYLYDPGQDEFLCLSHTTSVVRYPELAEPLQPLQVTPPLRILGMIASPSDQDRLDIKREKARMEEALKTLHASGQIELTWLAGQTWEDLQEAMWPGRGPWHIFHFIGHGGYDKRTDEGLIALCDEDGQTHLLSARDLARLLTAHSSLRLVVLNACEGARGGSRDLFSSTAATLARRGIPAVLAMQEEITDKAAIQLTRTFYRALAAGLPVDTAVAEARTAISVSLRHSLEWGTPVLFLRAPDSTLFTLSGTPAPPTVPPPDPPPQPPPKTKEHWVEEGEKHRATGRFLEALDCYEQALSQDGHDLRALRGRAWALKERHLPDALAAAEETLALHPKDAETHYLKGLVLREMGREEEALAAFDEAIKHDPRYEQARAARAEVAKDPAMQQEKEPLSQAALASPQAQEQATPPQKQPAPAPVAPQKTKEEWLTEGQAHINAKRYAEALAAFERALVLDERNADAWTGKGNALWWQSRSEEAIVCFARAHELRGQASEPTVQVAAAPPEPALKQRQVPQARGAPAPKQETREELLAQGNSFQVSERYTMALEAYEQALKLDSSYVEAWYWKGNALHHLKRYDDAVAAYKRALELNYQYASAWDGMSNALRALGRKKDAELAKQRDRFWLRSL